MVKGLLVAVLTCYAKLFSPSAKGRLVSLNIEVLKDVESIELHDQLIALRHGFAAHSGAEQIEICVPIVVFLPLEGGEIASDLVCELSQPSTFRIQDYEQIDSLMRFWLNYTEEKIQKVRAIVREELASGEMVSVLKLYERVGRIAQRRPS